MEKIKAIQTKQLKGNAFLTIFEISKSGFVAEDDTIYIHWELILEAEDTKFIIDSGARSTMQERLQKMLKLNK